MPIDYNRYPKDWKETRARILERANNRCEVCGLENGDTVRSVIGTDGFRQWLPMHYKLHIDNDIWDKGKDVKVVLTVAHLDHDEENEEVADDRLRAMCQLDHLRYDALEKARRRREKRGDGKR